ncbi:MAG: hypothetical protein H6569_04015 [Lewinellaceae bacterium]|nr:hypothetical protein [Lewinellaceae bacterium]
MKTGPVWHSNEFCSAGWQFPVKNVLVQVKRSLSIFSRGNLCIPMFGAMPKTPPLMAEFNHQEYLARARAFGIPAPMYTEAPGSLDNGAKALARRAKNH